MEEFTHDFLSFLPAALLTLAAAGAPEVYKLAARRFLDRAKSHGIVALHLVGQFPTPVAGLFRVLLGAAAVKSLPFELVRDAVFFAIPGIWLPTCWSSSISRSAAGVRPRSPGFLLRSARTIWI